MIALWMLYALTVTAFIAGIGWLLERAMRHFGRSVRWVWFSACIAVPMFMFAVLIGGRGDQHMDRDSTTHGPLAKTNAITLNVNHSVDGVWSIAAWWREQIRTVSNWQRDSIMVAKFRERADSWNAPLVVVWGIASFALTFGILRGARVVSPNRRTDTAADTDPNVQQFDGVDVYLTDSIGPAATGVRRPRILLPKWVAEMEPALQSLVLRHEWEHATSRDPALLMVAIAVVLVMPWNAVLWWSFHRLRLAVELDCDTRVLRRHADVQRYGRLLLLISERVARPRNMYVMAQLSAPSLHPTRSQLSRRIVAMTQLKKRRPIRAAMLVGAAIGIAACAYDIPSPAQRGVAVGVVAKSAVPLKPVRADVTLGSANGRPTQVMVYASESAQVLLEPRAGMSIYSDTLFIMTPAHFKVDLAGGDVNFVSVDGGAITLKSTSSEGPALGTSAAGKAFRLIKGGMGVATDGR